MNPVETSTLYLVRHAEKAAGDSQDPLLSEAGNARAAKLAQQLKDANIVTIYATPFNRTYATAEILAKQLGMEITPYEADEADFISSIANKYPGQGALIVGHSNTIPRMVNQLLGRQEYSDLQESEYDKLFVVKVTPQSVQATVQTY